MALLEPPVQVSVQPAPWPKESITLNVPRRFWTDEEFFDFCRANQDLRIELTATGRLIIMPPAGAETGHRNADITTDLTLWNRRGKTGIVFDSSAGFVLPNGAKRSPDVSWVEKSRWEALDAEDRMKFAHLCPDFVVELRSKTDRLSALQEKMREYMANGARLGWLIDPPSRRVEVYRPGREAEMLIAPASVCGDPELPGFTLDLTPIW